MRTVALSLLIDKIAINATEITAHTENTMADQKIWTLSPINRSTKHSIAIERIATSIKKYKAEAITEEETYLYNNPNNPKRVKRTKVIGSVNS